MSHIFISYARKDKQFTDKFVQALEANGLETWIDRKKIPPSVKWETDIYRNIEVADAFIFLFSKSSARSAMCQKEIACAAAHNKRILVVRILETGTTKLPPPLSDSFNWTECREDQDDFDIAIGIILVGIKKDYEWMQFHAELEHDALEWERNNKDETLLLGKTELQKVKNQSGFVREDKDPPPTDRQKKFVLESQIAEEKRTTEQKRTKSRFRNLAISLLTIAVASICTIIVVAKVLGRQVDIQVAGRTEQASTVQAQRATAQVQSTQAASTAQVQATTAANALATARLESGEAESVARRLAAQAQLLFDKQDSSPLVATLLAIESEQWFPNADADEVLRKSSALLLPLYEIIPTSHTEKITSVAFSSDGKTLNTTSDDGLVLSFEVDMGEQDPDNQDVDASNGRFSASVEVNAKYVTLVDTETGEQKKLPHEFFVFRWAFSPDGKHLASGGADGTIKLWDPTSGNEVGRIIKSGTVDFSLSDTVDFYFSPNSDFIASPVDKTIYLWHVPNSGSKFVLPNDGNINSTKIDPTGRWIASWNESENIVNISDIASNTVKTQIELKYGSRITSLDFSYDGNLLIAGDENGNTCIWKVPTSENTVCFFGKGIANVVAISPDLKFAATAHSLSLITDDFSTIWNIETGEKEFETPPGFLINNITFSNNSKLVAIAGVNKYVSLWDISSHKEIGRLQDYYGSLVLNDNGAIVFSSDGKWLITNGAEGTARVWNLINLEEFSRITYDPKEFFNLENVLKTVISPDQKKFASVNTVGIINLTLAAGTKQEATIRIWDPLSGKEMLRMVHNSWVNDIAWSPDGKYLLSGGQDGFVRIWDIGNGNEVGRITHGSPITQLRFTPDGKQVISISEDSIYRISYWDPDEIILQGCLRVTRNLSLSEWQQYFGNTEYHATCPNFPVPTQ